MLNQDVTGSATTMLPVPKVPGTRRSYQKHGLSSLIRGRSKAIGGTLKADRGQIDGRSAIGQAMSAYRADLLASLGGEGNLSAQELTLVEMVAKDWLILQSVDAYLLQAGLFNRRKRTAHPLTLQRMQISGSLTRRLQALGLARRAKPISNLAALLAAPPPAP